MSFLVKMLSLLENPSELWCICAPVLSYAVAFYQLESFVASANNFVASFGLLLVVLLGFLLLFYFVVLGFLIFFFFNCFTAFLSPPLLYLKTVNYFLVPQLKEVSSEI